MPNTSKNSGSKSTQGGSKAQHAEAGKQSHKNSVSKSTGQGRGKGSQSKED